MWKEDNKVIFSEDMNQNTMCYAENTFLSCQGERAQYHGPCSSSSNSSQWRCQSETVRYLNPGAFIVYRIYSKPSTNLRYSMSFWVLIWYLNSLSHRESEPPSVDSKWRRTREFSSMSLLYRTPQNENGTTHQPLCESLVMFNLYDRIDIVGISLRNSTITYNSSLWLTPMIRRRASESAMRVPHPISSTVALDDQWLYGENESRFQ